MKKISLLILILFNSLILTSKTFTFNFRYLDIRENRIYFNHEGVVYSLAYDTRIYEEGNTFYRNLMIYVGDHNTDLTGNEVNPIELKYYVEYDSEKNVAVFYGFLRYYIYNNGDFMLKKIEPIYLDDGVIVLGFYEIRNRGETKDWFYYDVDEVSMTIKYDKSEKIFKFVSKEIKRNYDYWFDRTHKEDIVIEIK